MLRSLDWLPVSETGMNEPSLVTMFGETENSVFGFSVTCLDITCFLLHVKWQHFCASWHESSEGRNIRHVCELHDIIRSLFHSLNSSLMQDSHQVNCPRNYLSVKTSTILFTWNEWVWWFASRTNEDKIVHFYSHFHFFFFFSDILLNMSAVTQSQAAWNRNIVCNLIFRHAP